MHNEPTKTGLLKRLYRDYAWPYRYYLLVAIALMLVSALSQGALAKLMEPVLDEIFVEKDRNKLVEVAFLVFITFFVKSIATFGESYILAYVGNKVVFNIQNHLYNHLLTLDLPFFQTVHSGVLVSRFTQDVGLLRTVVSNALISIGKDGATFIVLMGVMFYQDPWLAAVTFFIFPLAIWPIVKIGRRIRKITKVSQEEGAELTGLVSQTFQHVRQVQSYVREKFEASRAIDAIHSLFILNMKSSRVQALASPVMEMLAGVAIITVIIYGGTQVIEGERSTGSFFSFITALLMAYGPLKKLSRLNVQLQQGVAAAARLFELLDKQPVGGDKPDAKPITVGKGEVVFKNLDFQYGDATHVFKNFNLTLPAGKTTALVGASGSGKSTLINLLCRFFIPQRGEILVDGQSIHDATVQSLREQISIVTQETCILNDTAYNNIRYGRLEADDAAIHKAADDAEATAFIKQLPHTWDTQLGESGNRLSGGQRQRVAIARAILKDAPILLLDEATSALDAESERAVQSALLRLQKGRTTLVVAHRLSTVINADIIHVLEHGKIVESGSHKELLALDGLYAKLYRYQTEEDKG